MRKKKILLFATVVLLLVFQGCSEKSEPEIQLETVESEEEKQDTPEEKEMIFVYVCGAVCQEGVYEVKAGSRVFEAIEKAGGFAEGAAVTSVNQAALLCDEQQLYVPTVEEAEQQNLPENTGNVENGKINLNTAAKEELMTLAGIGEAKAESIIKYREEQGRFQSVEDIKQIQGIKDGVFEKIKEFITV